MLQFLALDNNTRYYVNHDTLFSYHKASEKFLQLLIALCAASHYKVNFPLTIQLRHKTVTTCGCCLEG